MDIADNQDFLHTYAPVLKTQGQIPKTRKHFSVY